MDQICKIIVDIVDYPLCSLAVNMLTFVLMLVIFRILDRLMCQVIDRYFIKH